MYGSGLNVGPVGQQPVEDVDRLVDAARDGVAEQRDVLVGHVVITDAAIAAVADVVLRQQVLLVDAPFGAVGRGALAAAPIAGQLDLVVTVDALNRSKERRVRKEGVRKCIYRWSP